MRGPSIVRPIVVLSAAAFASVATMRVADPLIPQIAQELDVSFGDASVITTAFAISYGLCRLARGTRRCPPARRRHRGRDRAAGAGLHRRPRALRAAPDGAGAVPHRNHPRHHRRPDRGRRARRPGRLARRLFSPGRAVSAGRQPARGRAAFGPRAAAAAEPRKRSGSTARGLRRPAAPAMGPGRPRHGRDRGLSVLWRVHLRGRLSARPVRSRLCAGGRSARLHGPGGASPMP